MTTASSGVELDESRSREDGEESGGDTTDSDEEGSESYHQRDVEGDQANTHVPSISRQDRPQPPRRGSSLSDISEAAGFGSDTSPRNETGGNEELSRAERK
jgi:hypothetical protein